MPIHFDLEYWIDEGWHVGRLKGVPGVLSQGATLEELEENIRKVYELMTEDEIAPPAVAQTKNQSSRPMVRLGDAAHRLLPALQHPRMRRRAAASI